MNEERQAKLLAEWLEGPPDQSAPEGIDADVLEAIYVLRPERAPPPRVSLEDILAGPSPSARTAGAHEPARQRGLDLDEAYEQGPITEPIDPGEQGPITEPIDPGEQGPITEPIDPGEQEPITDPSGWRSEASPEAAQPPPAEVDTEDEPLPELSAAGPWGAPPGVGSERAGEGARSEPGGEQLPAFGGLEGADPGMSKVIPFARVASQVEPPAPPSEFPPLDTDEPAASHPLEPPPSARTGPPARGIWRRWAYGAGGLAAAAALLLFSVTGPLSSRDEAGGSVGAPATAPAPQTASVAPERASLRQDAAPKRAASEEPASAGGAAALDALAELDEPEPAAGDDGPAAAPGLAAPEDRAASGDRAASKEIPAPEAAAEPEEVAKLEAADAPEEVAGLEAAAAPEEVAPPAEDEALEGGLALLDEEEPAEPPREAATRSARSRGASRGGGPSPAALAALKAAAYPADYEDSWYLAAGLEEDTLSRIIKTLQRVDTHTRYSEYMDASLACEPLIAEPDVRVGQDFAYRAAKYAWLAGDSARALELIERGIARGSANTFLLSMLHYTRGEILAARGDSAGAAAAWEVASNLNAARP